MEKVTVFFENSENSFDLGLNELLSFFLRSPQIYLMQLCTEDSAENCIYIKKLDVGYEIDFTVGKVNLESMQLELLELIVDKFSIVASIMYL